MATVNALKNQNVQFDRICRACLQIKKDMRPLFEQLTATMLMEISKVQVSMGDGLPTQLCLQCVHQISRCHSFKELVERNDIALREYAALLQQECAKAEAKNKNELMNMGCDSPDPYIYMSVSSMSNQGATLENLFDNEEKKSNLTSQDAVHTENAKENTPTENGKNQEDLDLEDDSYLQLVVFQASSSVAPGRHVCNLCQKEFKHARWLKQHMRSHSNWIRANCKKPPTCNICQRSFKGPGMLKMHMRTHEQRPPKQPTCTVCQRVFPTKTLLYRHRQTHFEQKMHQCTVCEKRFYSAYALRSHMARHRGERPYICSMCSKSFYNPTDLKVHFRLHTGEKPLKCVECNKTFRRHSTLCQHMKKHRGIRNHICNICSKGFYEVSKLNAHMRIHTGEKPYECQFCERKFAQQSALIYHRRTHTGEKPYACKVCSARFTTSSARNNHMITHTGHKKFVCSICFKGCSSRTELRVHSTKHTGEKLFACEFCEQRFSSASYLAVHRRYHTGERKHVCNVCGKGYVESGSYKKHMKMHESKQDAESPNSDDNSQAQKSESEGQCMDNAIPNEEEQPEQESHQASVSLKRYKCGLCVKTYMHVHSLKKHLVTHLPEQLQNAQQQQPQQQQQQQIQPQPPQQQTVLQVGGVQQLAMPIHAQHVQQGIAVSGVQVQAQQAYPVISSVQSLQLQQTQQQPQQLQVQAIQIHPQAQPIQIHAVGVQQVQQQQLHVATSSCQTMLPNILQLQPGTVAVSGLSQQDLSGVAHRIILQPQATAHPTVYLHH